MPDFLFHRQWLGQLSALWWDAKQYLSGALGLSHDKLHFLAGMILFPLLVRLLIHVRHRRPRREAFLLLLAAQLANEALDLALDIWPQWQRQLAGGLEDVILTMAIPTVTLLIVRIMEQQKPVADQQQ